MQRYTITETVKIPSAMLTPELKTNILTVLRAKEGSCNRTYGCILTVLTLDEILDSKVCVADSTNHFKISYTFTAFTPKVGAVYPATVVKSYQEGILVNLNGYESIRVLTEPAAHSEGDNVTVAVKELQFSGNNFIGVGSLIESGTTGGTNGVSAIIQK